jgi:hypothetical protein
MTSMRRLIVVAVALLVVVGAGLGGLQLLRSALPFGSPLAAGPGIGCVATASGQQFALDLDQAQNASIIAAVATQRGLPNHAVTIALATALQESRLQNLGYGDRDSLGLFQQRPSQGWGTPAQVQDPGYAANAFYKELVKVKKWELLDITVAAQKVQHSAFPNAYAKWEGEARIVARVMTGEVPAGFTCSFQPAAGGSTAKVVAAATKQWGPNALTKGITATEGWSVAAWLVANAYDQHLDSVSFLGQTWTVATNNWTPTPKSQNASATAAQSQVTYTLTPPN